MDVGSYGRNSDGSIFANSELGKQLESGNFPCPPPTAPDGCQEPLPPVLVGDEAFPLKKYLMRPYPRDQVTNNEEKQVFNYRLSRARRIVENAFGILVRKFSIFNRKIEIDVKKSDKVILACCVLHNMLRNDDTSEENADDQRDIQMARALGNMGNVGGLPLPQAMRIRETFTTYFNSPTGQVPWQLGVVRRGRRF